MASANRIKTTTFVGLSSLFNILFSIKIIKKDESTEISKLKERIFQAKAVIILSEITDNMLTKLQTGQAVILCNSYNCPLYQAFMCNLKLIYSDDHQFHSFQSYFIRKAHSHSKQISKV